MSCLPYTINSYQLDAWKIKTRRIIKYFFPKKSNYFAVFCVSNNKVPLSFDKNDKFLREEP